MSANIEKTSEDIVFFAYTGTNEKGLLEDVRERYGKSLKVIGEKGVLEDVQNRYGKSVKLIGIMTAPADWNGDIATLHAGHADISNGAFKPGLIDGMIVMQAGADGKFPAVEALAETINARWGDGDGTLSWLSQPYDCWNDTAIARLWELVPKLNRYAGVDGQSGVKIVGTLKDKAVANDYFADFIDRHPYLAENMGIAPYRLLKEPSTAQINSEEELWQLLWDLVKDEAKEQKRSAPLPENLAIEIKQAGKSGKETTIERINFADNPDLLRDIWTKVAGKRSEEIELVLSAADHIFKAISQDGSIASAKVGKGLSEAQLREIVHLCWEDVKPSTGRHRNFLLQDFVGDFEVGYHGSINGDMTNSILTMKGMQGTKEELHYIPGPWDDDFPRYERLKEVIFPVMEAMMKDLGMDIGQLNADIRLEVKGNRITFWVVDAQARSGLGRPKMLNGAFNDWHASEDRIALTLNMGDAEEAWRRLQSYEHKQAAISTVMHASGAWVISVDKIGAPISVRQGQGIYEKLMPALRAGDQISSLRNLLDIKGHGTYVAADVSLEAVMRHISRDISTYVLVVEKDALNPEGKSPCGFFAVDCYKEDLLSRRFRHLNPLTFKIQGLNDEQIQFLVDQISQDTQTKKDFLHLARTENFPTKSFGGWNPSVVKVYRDFIEGLYSLVWEGDPKHTNRKSFISGWLQEFTYLTQEEFKMTPAEFLLAQEYGSVLPDIITIVQQNEPPKEILLVARKGKEIGVAWEPCTGPPEVFEGKEAESAAGAKRSSSLSNSNFDIRTYSAVA